MKKWLKKMKKERKIIKMGSLLLFLVLFGVFPTPLFLTVRADPFVTLTFTGTVTGVGVQCPAPGMFAGAVVGDSWTLTYTFDASTSDVDGSSTAGQYRNPITYMTLEIGSTTVSGTPGQAIPGGFSSMIFVNLVTSGFADYGVQTGLPDTSTWASVNLYDDTGTPYADDSLPLSIPTPLETKFPTLRHFSLRNSTLVCIEGTVEDPEEVGANAGKNQIVSMGDDVVLDGSASSGQFFHWEQHQYSPLDPESPIVTLTGENTPIATFIAPSYEEGGSVESLIFKLIVSDEAGNLDTDIVVITIVEDLDRAIFVSTNLGDDMSNDGSKDAPVQSLTKAFELASQTTPHSDIYVDEGDYDETEATLTILDDMSIYGGFSTTMWNSNIDWERARNPDPEETRIFGAATALKVLDIVSPTVINGLTINSANGLNGELTGGAGENSIGIYVRTATDVLRIFNNNINAGHGGVGKSGEPGLLGRPGGDGIDASGSSAGSGGNNDWGRFGGRGGTGGLRDLVEDDGVFVIFSLLAQAGCLPDGYIFHDVDGHDGFPAAGVSGSYATGGVGVVVENDIDIPYSPDIILPDKDIWGSDGASAFPGFEGSSGAHGAGGIRGSTWAAMFADHNWMAHSGKAGINGRHGYGAHGGGGGAGALAWLLVPEPLTGLPVFVPYWKFGGGGGGGGGGGEGGKGGQGGYGGGASFGVFLSNAQPVISGNTISTAGGSSGGNGGPGSPGGPGGEGGSGQDVSWRAGDGGDGGDGRPGGAGGYGGGGAGGSSCGIYLSEGSQISGLSLFPWQTGPENSFSIGPAGEGGLGGDSEGHGEAGCRGEICPPPGSEIPLIPDTPLEVYPQVSIEYSVTVPLNPGNIIFKSFWVGSDVIMTLVSPSGRVIDRNTVESDVFHEKGSIFEGYRIINPEVGEWTIVLFGADVPPEGENVVLKVTMTPINNPPLAVVQNVVVVAGTNGLADASIDSGSYDPDEHDVLLITQTPVGPYPLGETVVTLTISDGWGAFDTAQATVTVIDQTPPIITCPADVIAQADESGGMIVPLVVTITDNCDLAPILTSDQPIDDWYPLGSTLVTFVAIDASGNSMSCVMSVTVVENLPPLTTDDYLYDDIWINAEALITLTATDPTPSSGIAWTRYIIDDTGTSTPVFHYLEPLLITNEGIYYLRYHSKDIAHNVEIIRQIVIRIDKTAPTTELTIGDPQYIKNGLSHVTAATLFTLNPEDTSEASGVFSTLYRIFNTEYDSGLINYLEPFALTGIEDGVYTLEYYSVDYAGNIEPINSLLIALDTSAPITTWLGHIPEPPYLALQDGVVFKIQAYDISQVKEVKISIRERGDTNVIFGETLVFDPIDNLWESARFETLDLDDGYYELIVEAKDNFDFQSSTEFIFSIRNWAVLELLPASQSYRAGRTMPIKFSLKVHKSVDPDQPFVRNEELRILIYDSKKPGKILQESFYGDTSRDYRIDSTNFYITNFKTSKIPKIYVVEVWRGDNMLIDSFEFFTYR